MFNLKHEHLKLNQLVTVVRTLIAIGVSWRAVFTAALRHARQTRFSSISYEIEITREKREALSSKQADSKVEISLGESFSYTFYCTNQGGGIAKQFRVLWNDRPLQTMKGTVRRRSTILAQVKPGETVMLEMERAFEQAKLSLEWRDEVGEKHSHPFTLHTAIKRIP